MQPTCLDTTSFAQDNLFAKIQLFRLNTSILPKSVQPLLPKYYKNKWWAHGPKKHQ